jgi:hypothetical protein
VQPPIKVPGGADSGWILKLPPEILGTLAEMLPTVDRQSFELTSKHMASQLVDMRTINRVKNRVSQVRTLEKFKAALGDEKTTVRDASGTVRSVRLDLREESLFQLALCITHLPRGEQQPAIELVTAAAAELGPYDSGKIVRLVQYDSGKIVRLVQPGGVDRVYAYETHMEADGQRVEAETHVTNNWINRPHRP